jgi:TetR/AcrR family transcriptional regulator, transcriptional repressor for nem operon
MCIFGIVQSPMGRKKKFDETEALAQALFLFKCKGYSDVSIEELTAALALNRSSLYNTFESKHHLFIMSLKRFCEANHEWLRRQVCQCTDALLFVRTFLYSALVEPTECDCLAARTAAESAAACPQIRCVLEDNQRQIRGFLAQVLEKGQVTGQIHPDIDPPLIALWLYNTMLGFQIAKPSGITCAEIESIIAFQLKIIAGPVAVAQTAE